MFDAAHKACTGGRPNTGCLGLFERAQKVLAAPRTPSHTPCPLGTGAADMKATIADVPAFDPTGFDVPAVKVALARAAGTTVQFTH